MATAMAVKRGVKVRGSDRCAYCGEPMSLARNIFGLLRGTAYETGWDGQAWRPYHRICWQQARHEGRGRQAS
jgi:ribosomal protein S14